MDPVGRAQIWDYIKTLKKDNDLTILLTTHYLDEAQQLADRIGILNKGILVTEGNPQKMIDELGEDIIRISGYGFSESLRDTLASQPFIRSLKYNNDIIQTGLEASSKHLATIVGLATERNFHIEDISVIKPDLGSVFLKHTGELIK